ncbi:hypothetical protein E1B28_012434 [Marasmius oreades]|uniref:SHSP domain-containing protein n=1 Tax=Marasmius oreades TaxID=181124 RepID=A0A9P7UN86_9AGAR|nr:uncharacterized protein E1B28_012434 [Marasmius oreades]KAG7088442.1 hypothetical protein E1B28_012434 [Marasmius oreades]
MSIRQLLHEFRPFFRLLEEPIARPPSYFGLRARPFFEDPFFHNTPAFSQPAVDITEEGNKFIVEADLPGVPKENVEVRIGDGGHSITISGKTFDKRHTPQATENLNSEGGGADDTQTVVHANSQSNQLSTERQFVSDARFTRTVWLPKQVDGSSVAAKLKDGVLTVTIPKSEDKGSVVVSVE